MEKKNLWKKSSATLHTVLPWIVCFVSFFLFLSLCRNRRPAEKVAAAAAAAKAKQDAADAKKRAKAETKAAKAKGGPAKGKGGKAQMKVKSVNK